MDNLLGLLGEQGDPSLPLALAALLNEADPEGSADFARFAAAFRSEVQRALEAEGQTATELSGDEVHDNLVGSVLPRLLDAGLIAPPGSDGWQFVRASGSWWDNARDARDETRTALLAAARLRGERRRGQSMTRRAPPVAGGSVLEGRNLSKSFKRRRVVDQVPDGYTLYAGGGGFWTTTLLRKMPYDVVKDFTPISLIVREVLVVTVNPSVPAKSIKELIALAKARPGVLNYGSSGIGNATHLSAELFKSMAGVNIVHAPYKGVSAALTSLINGEIQLLITDMGNVAPHIKSGKVRALAITTAETSALAPGLPTVSASGLPGYESLSITGIFALAGTPEPIVRRLNQEMVRFVRTSDAKERFLAYSQVAVGSSPEEFAATVKSEIAKLGKVIKDAAIKAE